MNAISIHGNSIDALEKQLHLTLESDHHAPTLAFVFCDHRYDLDHISTLFRAHDIAVCGASTAGEIVDDKVIDESIVCLLLTIPRSYFEVVKLDYTSSPQDVAKQMGKTAKERFSKPSLIIVSSGLETDGEAVVNGLLDSLGPEAKIFGGLAGDNFDMVATYVFDSHSSSEAGLTCVIFDSTKVQIDGVAASGWKAVGIEKIVTKSVGNIVYTIDHEPALDVYKKNFGLNDELDPRTGIVNTLGVQYPLQVKRENGQAVIRAPLLANPENNSLIFAGAVQQGATVQFSVPPHFDIVKEVVREVELLKKETPKVTALIMFSCKARHTALGPMIEDEISGVQSLWKAPMAGFFSYGEFGALAQGQCDFHNETCSLVLIQEK
jgi:hypothetical protein